MKVNKDLLLSQFMKWFFLNQLVSLTYVLMIIAVSVENYVAAVSFALVSVVIVCVAWVGMARSSYRLWRGGFA